MSTQPQPIRFAKYDQLGAYHWRQCERRSSSYNPPVEARFEVVRRRLRRVNRILDVGCGDGYLMNLASAYGATVIGIDAEFSATWFAHARLASMNNCRVAQASCYDLPFADGSFDLILLTDVFEHLECPEACLHEICRVLGPAGTLLLTTPRWRPDRMWDSLHFKEYSPAELTNALASFFGNAEISYFWPLAWSKKFTTRYGFQLIRIFARHFYNPFMHEGTAPEKFGQMLAVCER